MWKIKDKYKGKVVSIRGIGKIDFSKEEAESLYKRSLVDNNSKIINYLEKESTESKPKK